MRIRQPHSVPSPYAVAVQGPEGAPDGSAVSSDGPEYGTTLGAAYAGTAERLLETREFRGMAGKVDLILTSPPFPLIRKKRYGNLSGDQYLNWLARFAPTFRTLLSPSGSIVVEIGNAWEPGEPVMSTLPLRALLAFLDAGDLQLCQEFICYNPARLPGPAQWVNIERVRVKDAFTHVWWMAPQSRPKADNRKVLAAYGKRMLRLLRTQEYNSGHRPSEHSIGRDSFLRNNGGAIPSNVLTFANTGATDRYQQFCRARGLQPHPARMPMGLADFFIRFLTQPDDLVLDPFAGSNVTGAVAEDLKRRWVSIELSREYVLGSYGRFDDAQTKLPVSASG